MAQQPVTGPQPASPPAARDGGEDVRSDDERGYDEAVNGGQVAARGHSRVVPPPAPDTDAPLFDPDADTLEAHRAPPGDGGNENHPTHDSDIEDELQEDYEADIERERQMSELSPEQVEGGFLERPRRFPEDSR